jgi:hypothetical protein
MVKTFVVSDENIVNGHGFRVMTDGIDLTQYKKNPIVLYMHDRGRWKRDGSDGSEVIGKAVKLYKKDGQLLADVEFDMEDKFSKKIAGKVERDFIRMTSIGADPIETSVDPKFLLPNQRYETVTASKLFEISICDIGSNDNAIRLSHDGQPVQLQLINTENKPNMSIKPIALAMGLDADISVEKLETAVLKLTKEKTTAEARVQELEDEIKLTKSGEANTLIDRGIALGLIQEEFKDAIELAFEKDHDGQKVKLTKLIEAKEKEAGTEAAHGKVKEIHLSGKGAKGTAGENEECFDFLQKHNPMELARLHKEDNAKYVELAKAYGEGKRFVPKN